MKLDYVEVIFLTGTGAFPIYRAVFLTVTKRLFRKWSISFPMNIFVEYMAARTETPD